MECTELTLKYERLPAAWAGLRVAFIADLHCRSVVTGPMAVVMDYLTQHEPDVVILGGDIVNHRKHWPFTVDWLRKLPGRKLRAAVPGNWEYKRDNSISEFRRQMDRAGFAALVNDAVVLREDNAPLAVAGIDDVRHGVPDIRRAFAAVPPESFVVAACHSPDVLLSLQPRQFDLLLCGHTHGGQIRIPKFGALITSTRLWKRYEMGLYEPEKEHRVYISRGVGTGDISLRLFCPPELSIFTLS